MKNQIQNFQFITVLCVLLLSSGALLAQTRDSDSFVEQGMWASGGAGLSGDFFFNINATASISLNYQHKSILFTGRYVSKESASTVFFLIPIEGTVTEEFAILSGIATRSKRYHASLELQEFPM